MYEWHGSTMMESSPQTEASWKSSATYSRIFRPRSTTRKIQKRSSLPNPIPEPGSGSEPAFASATKTAPAPAPEPAPAPAAESVSARLVSAKPANTRRHDSQAHAIISSNPSPV
ncbi:hypothetical protein F4777DRAFT_256268 [Nemania sp. FL0916]|nr:hypothetical protein F4777DRAFT_256268 [Nemania sp. FL0916]